MNPKTKNGVFRRYICTMKNTCSLAWTRSKSASKAARQVKRRYKHGDANKFMWAMKISYAGLVSVAADAIDSSVSQISNIFILAGQSNMAGRGGVVNDTWDGVVPPQCGLNPLVFRLDAKHTWVEAQEPLHKDIDWSRSCGVGPGMAFANAVLSKHPNLGVVGLVPCAVGGTNISEWSRGSHLYNQLVSRTRAALQSGGTIRALLWYQGEKDTLNLEDAKLYKKRLHRFLNHVRSDLQSPALPVILVALASGGPYMEMVRQAQLGIELPNVKRVDAMGLLLEPDGLHLTTPSQVQLGQMLANAFLPTAPLPVQSNGPRRYHNFVFNFLLSFGMILNFLLSPFK